jgi:predicted O-linked N-acetylglucosamine transferase (SPINDLY family)
MKKDELRRRKKQREGRRDPRGETRGNLHHAESSPPSAVPRSADDWSQGLAFHQTGQLAAAKDAYCRVLQRDPKHADAWHMLGMVMYQGQEHAAAMDCLQQARNAGCQDPGMLSNLGLIHRALGELDESRRWLEQAVVATPTRADAWNNLGTVQLEQFEFEAAESSFRRALSLDPHHQNALSNLGTALQNQRRFQEAQQYHEQAVERNPLDVSARNNLGCTLRSQRKFQEAEQIFRSIVQMNPDVVEAQINHARALLSLGRPDEAIGGLRNLIERQPQSAIAQHYLGMAYQQADQQTEAADCFRRAVQLDPEYAHAMGSLGTAELRRGRREEALHWLRESLRLRPDLHESHSNLLFILSNDDRVGAAELFAEHVEWGRRHGHVADPFTEWAGTHDPLRKLRVAYISPDLRDHAVARFIEPVLRHHDPDQVDVFCYAQVYQPDAMTEHLKSFCHTWRSTCGLSYRQVAEMIHEDGIDLIVDLAGHTAGNRLLSLAYRPAPIQVSWLGYPNTTGLTAIDYRLTSEIQDPESDESFHTESLVRLPCGTNCFEPPDNAPDVQSPPSIATGTVTFGSLHRPQKISPPVLDLWARVLNANPTSRLLLFNTMFDSETRVRVQRELVQRGVVEDRIEIRNRMDHQGYLHQYHQIDIALDVFPWNGGTTTREALWMGVAVVGLLGERRSARGTAATLHYAGLPELIARTPDDYVRVATELASDGHRLTELRHGLRDRLRATICNAPAFTRQLEAAYRRMWKSWCLTQSAIANV